MNSHRTISASLLLLAGSVLQAQQRHVSVTVTTSNCGVVTLLGTTLDIPICETGKLAFVQQPTSTYAGYSLPANVAVVALDASGKPLITGSVPVTVSLLSNATGAVLAGTQSATSAATPALFPNLSLSKAGTGYSLVATSPGYASVTSASFNMTALPAASTFYVSNTGNDASDGKSMSTPWKTISKVNAGTYVPGSQVLLRSGGVWHEQLLPKGSVRYAGYASTPSCTESAALVPSCTNMPIIDGADAVTGWVSYGAGAYKAPFKTVASKGFVDSLYKQTTPLDLSTSSALVASTSGTIFSDGSFVYVHLMDGSDPSAHTVEVSGARSYGIFVNGPSGVVIDGIAVIRTSKSGYLNWAFPGTGSGNIVQNSLFFNTEDSLGDASLGGQIGGAIASIAGYQQAPPPGFVASGNLVGRSDVPHDTLNYALAGINVSGMASPQVVGNRVATVNGWAIRVQDWLTDNTCISAFVLGNETVNSEGNVSVAGCPQSMVKLNHAHDSLGNFAQLGQGLIPASLDTGTHLEYNTMTRLLPAYGNGLYNGIDVNFAASLVIIGNRCSVVASACLTLEADAGASSGATVTGNTFDMSSGVTFQGLVPSDANRAYPFYIRDTSLVGLVMSGNTFIMSPASPFIKYGSTEAGDRSRDLTMAQFDSACLNCRVQ